MSTSSSLRSRRTESSATGLASPRKKLRGRRVAAPIAALAWILALPATAEEETYTIDPRHSQPYYEVRHLGFSQQRGTFLKLSGTITLDRVAKTGTVNVLIDPASVRSSDPVLDNVLKSEAYFNVERFPTLTFRSNDVRFDGDRVVEVVGDLTMLGVTRAVTLKVDDFACGVDPVFKRALCGAEVTTTIKRSDWGMTRGIPFAPADEVKIAIPVEAYRR
ncbi:MAG TPA: YceI family protein [Casimicrobiaceae bacterium]